MTKITRRLLIMAVAALMVLAGHPQAVRAAAGPFTKYAPDGTNGVVIVDVAKILASRPITDIIAKKSPVQYFTDEMFEHGPGGEDWKQKWDNSKFPKLLDGVLQNTASVQWLLIDGRHVNIVLEGKYDSAKLAEEMKQALLGLKLPFKANAAGNHHELVSLENDFFAFCIVSNEALVFGDRAGVELVLARIDSKAEPKLDKTFDAKLAELTLNHAAVGAMIDAPRGGAGLGAADTTMTMSGTFDIDEKNIRGVGTVVFPNEEAAAAATLGIGSGLKQVSGDLGHSPRALPVVKFLGDAKIDRVGKKVTIEMTLPSDQAAAALSVLFDPPSDIEPAAELTGLPDDVRGIAISSDGKLVAGVAGSKWEANAPPDSGSKTLILWDAATKQPVFKQTFESTGAGAFFDGFVASFDPTNQFVAISTTTDDSGKIVIVDVKARREAKRIDGRQGIFSHDGRFFACCHDSKITLYDPKTWELLRDMQIQNEEPVVWIEFSPDGRSIAGITGRISGALAIWKTGTGAQSDKIVLPEHKPLSRFIWSPDGHRLAIADQDGAVRIWEVTARLELQAYPLFGQNQEITSLAYGAGGKTLAAASTFGLVKVVDLNGGDTLVVRAKKPTYRGAMACNPVDNTLILGGSRKAYVWKLPAK